MEHFEEFLTQIKEARIGKNISLEEVSQKTRINIKFLEALEDGNISFLPKPYVLAFIKSFARSVGINEREVEGKFANIAHQPEIEIKDEAEETEKIESEKTPGWFDRIKSKDEESGILGGLNFRLLAVAAAVIALLIYVGTQMNPSREQFEVTGPQITEEEMLSVPESTTTVTPQSQSLRLRGVASARTWLSIIFDGNETREFNLQSGDQITWTANESFQFRIGRAHALSLSLNGRELGPLGPETSLVWDMVINKNGIASKELRTRTDLPQQSSPDSTQSSGAPQ